MPHSKTAHGGQIRSGARKKLNREKRRLADGRKASELGITIVRLHTNGERRRLEIIREVDDENRRAAERAARETAERFAPWRLGRR